MWGVVATDQTSSNCPDKLKAATALLRHRGPDAQRIWISANQQVGLVHTRGK